MTPEIYKACSWAVHVIKNDGEVLRAGKACLYLLEALGWKFSAFLLRLPPFIWFVELGYLIVARNRVFFARYFFRSKKNK